MKRSRGAEWSKREGGERETRERRKRSKAPPPGFLTFCGSLRGLKPFRLPPSGENEAFI